MDKPLHVRVAEALGCKPEFRSIDWFCPCEPTPENLAARKQPGWTIHSWLPGGKHTEYQSTCGLRVARYDISWFATGPLIEKYEITIGVSAYNGKWIATTERYGEDFGYDPSVDFQETPLIAVCNLILALKEAGKL